MQLMRCRCDKSRPAFPTISRRARESRPFESVIMVILVTEGHAGDESSLSWRTPQSLNPTRSLALVTQSSRWAPSGDQGHGQRCQGTYVRAAPVERRNLMGHLYARVPVFSRGLLGRWCKLAVAPPVHAAAAVMPFTGGVMPAVGGWGRVLSSSTLNGMFCSR